MENNEYMEPCPCCEEQRYYNIKLKPCANGDMGIALSFEKETDKEGLAMVVFQRCMAAGYVDLKFCPYCGKPQTYEVFNEMWERVKELSKKEQREGLSVDMLYSLIKNR